MADSSTGTEHHYRCSLRWNHVVSLELLYQSTLAKPALSSTFPSVYVVYWDVSATNDCGIIGEAYSTITIIYGSSELRTITGGSEGTNFSPINYANLSPECSTTKDGFYPSDRQFCYEDTFVTDARQSSQCLLAAMSANIAFSYYENCRPGLEHPAKLRAIDPERSLCDDFADASHWYAVYDPPQVLILVYHLVLLQLLLLCTHWLR